MTTDDVCAHFVAQFILCTGCNVYNLNQGTENVGVIKRIQ